MQGAAGPLDDEFEPGRHRLRRAPADTRTRRKAVVEYAASSRTSRQVGEELGVGADVVRNWKHKMLPGDDKECAMSDDADEGRTPKAREGRHRDDGGGPLEDMRRERDEIRSQLTRIRAELEIIRYTKELLGKREGADPDNLTNSERTRLVPHLADKFDMMPRELLGRCGLSRSTFYDNRKRLGRPGNDEWLLEPVMPVFEQSHEQYGY